MLYRLSHFLGDGNMYHQHFIDTNHKHGQDWIKHVVADAQTNSHPDYALKVEVFEPTETFTVRPHERE